MASSQPGRRVGAPGTGGAALWEDRDSCGGRRALTGAGPAVLVQPEAGLAGAPEGASQVGAEVLTATVAGGTLVHIWGQTRAAEACPLGSGARQGPLPLLCPLD